MKLASVRYLVGEGFKNTWVNRLMSIASIGVLMACMAIIGLAILITENVNLAMGNLEQQNVVMAYMEDYNWALYNKSSDSAKIKKSDYTIHNEKEAKALCDEIAKISNVASVTYVSSEEGLETVKNAMSRNETELKAVLDGDNPLSCAAKITFNDMAIFDRTLEEIEQLEGIDVIQSQRDLAKTITALKNGIGVAGVWIIAILMVIALVIVSNTIRVTMYNRKLEISIMKAVGATDAFVRLPFVVEGMVIGVVSALLAEGVLYFCYRVATETIITTLGTSDIVQYADMAWPLLGIFVSIGVFSGIIGSVIMISKYLRKEGSEFAAI